MKFRIVLLLLLGSFGLKGQDLPMIQDARDSTVFVLSFDDYYDLVFRTHPLVKQGRLLGTFAEEQVRLARGSFDPKLEANWTGKQFNDTEYFNLLETSLKIPVWFPIDPMVGFERNRGTFLNPENFISEKSDNRQLYAGLSLPIGQGLFIDQRRAMVKQAYLFQEMTDAEQVSIVNKVLLQAAKDYWDWYFAYNNYLLMERSLGLAEDIFSRTLVGFEFGEVAAIDTVQAKIVLLNRKTDFQQASMAIQEAMLVVSNHLWDDSGIPLEIRENTIPGPAIAVGVDDTLLSDLITLAQENHPDLIKLDVKGRQLEVDRRLAVENLKPRLNLSYYWLDQPLNTTGDWTGMGFGDNYKFGVDFAFPLFLRKERAKVNQTEIKQLDNALQQDFSSWQIINEVNRLYVTLVNTDEMIDQQSDMVDNYRLILQAEQLNLENGESDLFKINVQLDKLIESETKLFKLRALYQKSLTTLYWQAGVPFLDYFTN